jgi:hypothetical protein
MLMLVKALQTVTDRDPGEADRSCRQICGRMVSMLAADHPARVSRLC